MNDTALIAVRFVILSFTAGHVGPPVPCNIIKLVDVEEKEYFARNGQGEV